MRNKMPAAMAILALACALPAQASQTLELRNGAVLYKVDDCADPLPPDEGEPTATPTELLDGDVLAVVADQRPGIGEFVEWVASPAFAIDDLLGLGLDPTTPTACFYVDTSVITYDVILTPVYDITDLCPDDSKTEPGVCGCGVSDDDADSNGVPDCLDAGIDFCPEDPEKTLPGVCGCGTSDADGNNNGIPDCLENAVDLCPNDPAKTLPGVCGCDTSDADANGNGEPDCLDLASDLCPDDPNKTVPGICGCGASDADNNLNGVPDCLDPKIDLCPNDPNKILPGICGCGLSDADASGNGVPDCLDDDIDLCPEDPNKTVPGICGCGVSDADADGNGLADCLDAGQQVPQDGEQQDGTTVPFVGCGILGVHSLMLMALGMAGLWIARRRIL